uniref:CSON009479 protein n=1 Tax=Culicoides sonorensis TaxID=179676 RepID=A0A336M0F4_CULSO
MTVTNRRRISNISNNRIAPFNSIPDQSEVLSPDYSNQNDHFPFPKHLPFPQVSNNSDIFNEFYLFIFAIMCAALQFIHLYRTTFWLEQTSSHTTTINFYLIDKYLVNFIFIISSRRLIYCLLERGYEYIYTKRSKSLEQTTLKYIKYAYFTGIIVLLLLCSWKIFQKYSFLYIICLFYPLFLYMFIFRFKIDAFLKTNYTSDPIIMNGYPVHSCSINAHTIRTEIEALKNDFNNRFKQVFLGAFTTSLAYCFPVRYSDVLHRASLHLGVWLKISTRNHPPPIPWNKSVIWPFGTYVKYSGDIYRSNSNSTCATPANNSHYRFYTIFKNPSNIYSIMATIQAIIVIIQLLMLMTCSEWPVVLSLSFLILFNFYTLFKLLRDFLVAKSIYSAETAVNDKLRCGNI